MSNLTNVWMIVAVVVGAIAILGGIIKGIKGMFAVYRWKLNVDGDLKKFGGFMDEVKGDIKSIFSSIEQIRLEIARAAGKRVEQTTSPITLTEYGESLAETVKVSDILQDSRVDRVKAAVRDMNAYQIQEYCFDFSKGELLDDLKENESALHKSIYELAFNEGIDVEKISRVIALKLRDRILSDFNKPKSEIDDHAPG